MKEKQESKGKVKQQREQAQAVENPPIKNVDPPKVEQKQESKGNSPMKNVKNPANSGIIGSYRITKTLGQGTFGKVKEGVHIFTEQKVAIKILEKNKITDVNDVERVTREIHILKIVSHPNIIQLYEIIETPCRLFLIMEHCCNGELFSYITSKNKLKEEESCRLFQQLIAALEYLGRLGIVHRDVKPENLLLDEQLNLKVVDFGLSNTFNPGEKLSTACGSPCYAAPELIKGLEYLGPKADLWSAGVVLYTLVCGHLPFEDNNTQSLYQKILSADYKFTCYLSREVRNLIENILVPDPELRYGLKQITSNTWFKCVNPLSFEISSLGRQVGIDKVKVYQNVLEEMEQCKEAELTASHVKKCIYANRFNSATSHYYLLIKKKIILGEKLIVEKARNNVQGEEGDTERLNHHMDPSQRAIMAVGRQTKKYQSIEPQRTTLYNEKNKYQLRKIAEGLHEFSNIKKITAAPENSIAESNPATTRMEMSYIMPKDSSIPGSKEKIKAGNANPDGSGGTNPGQKFLFSPTLTDEANEEQKDDDYLCSQQKGQGQMIFSPTGQRTSSHFRQFPISPTNQQPDAPEKIKPNELSGKVRISSHTTESIQSNKRPFESNMTTIDPDAVGGDTNELITSDDQGNQIYQIFGGLDESSSKILPTLKEMDKKTVGDMLNRPNTGFEIFGRGSSVGTSQLMISENRNVSSYQLENARATDGIMLPRPGLGGSGGIQPGQPYKRKTAYNVTQTVSQSKTTKKKTSHRGDQYHTRKASSNLDFLKNGSSSGQGVTSQTPNINAPYPRAGQHKMFDQQIRQLLNQSQIVESDNQMLLIESGTTNVGATDLRKMTSQLAKQMPNVTRISAMSNYNTTQIRPTKQSKQKVRQSGTSNGTVQHGLLNHGMSTGVKVQEIKQRKTLKSTRETLDRIVVQGQAQKSLATHKVQSNKNPPNATIPAPNTLRKGSMSIISPTSKPQNATGCSGTTQNTRLISSGSNLQGGALMKTSSAAGSNNNNTATKKGSKTILKQNRPKGEYLTENNSNVQNLNQSHINNANILSNLVSPNNQVAAQFLNANLSDAITTHNKAKMNQTGIQFLPTSPLNMMTPGPTTMNRLQGLNASTIENDRMPEQISQNLSVGLNSRPPKNSGMNQTQTISNQNTGLLAHNRAGSTSTMNNPTNPNQKRKTTQVKQAQSIPAQKLQQTDGQRNLAPYLITNLQGSSTNKQRNAVARANSTLAYTSSSSQNKQQQLSDFIIPTQFQQQVPSSIKQNQGKGTFTQGSGMNNPLQTVQVIGQGTRNMHARAMTSLGTSSNVSGHPQPLNQPFDKFINRAPPSIMSPTNLLPADLIELKSKQISASKPNPPQKISGGPSHRRENNSLMSTQTPQNLQSLLNGAIQSNQMNFNQNVTSMVTSPSPQPQSMFQAQIKPVHKQQQHPVNKFTNNGQAPKSSGQRRPPSARNRNKLQATGQSFQSSQIMSPTGQVSVQKK